MKKILITIIVLLSFSSVVEAQEAAQAIESKQAETFFFWWEAYESYEESRQAVLTQRGFELFFYPEEVNFGDPIYIVIHIKNISEEPAKFITNTFERDDFRLALHSESISVPYYLLYEDPTFGAARTGHRISRSAYSLFQEFQPGDSRAVFVAYQELPTLEDMDHPFWEEAKKRLSAGENIVCHIAAEYRFVLEKKSGHDPNKVNVAKSLLIKPRPAAEMELLERWREGTPEWLWPVPSDQMFVQGSYMKAIYFPLMENDPDFDPRKLVREPGFVSKARDYKFHRNDKPNFPSNECFIKVRGQDYFPYLFLRQGNRKPGDPICLTTWQGWRELEDSLVPSTMRDEIRMVRILIQYCDTEDKAVLKELQEWFATMNEIQRTIMTELLLGQILNRGSKILPQFGEVYYAISEYGARPVSEETKNDLENLLTQRRLTWILTQYRDAEDDSLLRELKEWFGDIDEARRTKMAEFARDQVGFHQATLTSDGKILPQFREFYQTIREYDVAPINVIREKYLREIGLFE